MIKAILERMNTLESDVIQIVENDLFPQHVWKNDMKVEFLRAKAEIRKIVQNAGTLEVAADQALLKDMPQGYHPARS